MEKLIFLILILLISNFLFVRNFEFISKIYNLYDSPDEKRKKQLKPVPLLGGLLFLKNLIIFFCFNYFFQSKSFFYSLGFTGEIKIFVFCIAVLGVFFVGFIDDKIKIKPFTKLILLSLILYVVFSINPKIVVNSLNFSIYENHIDLFNLGIIFSILCTLTYINALNMLDGINLVSSIYYLALVTIFLLYNFQISFTITFLIFITSFMLLNYNGRAFLGDSGVYIISFLLSLLIISLYEKNNLKVENIFLFMFLPIIDFFRLIVTRIINKKHPFDADENHFHHIISKKFSNKKIYVLTFFIFFPIIFDYFVNLNIYIIILTTTTFYYFFLKKNFIINS